MLRTTQELFQVPFVELLSDFRSSGVGPGGLRDELVSSGKWSQGEIDCFVEGVRKGLLLDLDRGGFELYTHQLNMLINSAVNEKNSVVTSPTGSGKTESFLLPIFLHLFSELRRGRSSHKISPRHHFSDRWWRGTRIQATTKSLVGGPPEMQEGARKYTSHMEVKARVREA